MADDEPFTPTQAGTIKDLAFAEAVRACNVGAPHKEGTMEQQIPPYTLLGGPENVKLMFDHQLESQREQSADHRGWEELKLRRANNRESIDHMVNAATHLAGLGALLAAQTGVTEGQQIVSPAGTAASEALKGAVGAAGAAEAVAAAGTAVSAQAIATSLGNLASALVPLIVASGGVVTAQTLAALLPVVIAATGTATTAAAK